ARFPHSKRLEYYQSYIFLSPLERNLRCYSDYNNPTPINILFPLSDKLSLPIHQFPILIVRIEEYNHSILTLFSTIDQRISSSQSEVCLV
ncbi:hypothetical protein Avbf_18256, partial [Armadillidium vulgare]